MRLSVQRNAALGARLQQRALDTRRPVCRMLESGATDLAEDPEVRDA